MRRIFQFLLLWWGLGGAAMAQDAGAPSGPLLANDPGYASQFQCPESLASDEARRLADDRFLQWASRAHPDWRVEDTMNYRLALLQAKQCRETLNSMVNDQPANP